MARIAAGNAVQAQDVRKGMLLTNGRFVFRAARVVPMHLTGILIKDESGVRVEPTYTHVQIITARGNVLNLKITDSLVPLVPVNL
jgi:hypothetical protein